MNIRRGICVLFMVCLSLVGCSAQEKIAGAVLSEDSHALTQAQMLEDYDAMWRQIEENYPLMGVAERTTEKDFSEVKADYREQVPDCKSDGAFFLLIQNCLEEFEGCGHMTALSKEDYETFCGIYQDVGKGGPPHYKYLLEILQNPASRTFYQSGGNSEGTSAPSEEEDRLKASAKPRTFPVWPVEEGVAYLRLPSFDTQLLDRDLPGLEEFFEEISDWDACIIDIRGNPGGNTYYWQEGIVALNLHKAVSFPALRLVRGESSKIYLSSDGVSLQPIASLDRARYPNLNLDDLAQMQYYTEDQMSAQPSRETPLFKGDFYVLTNEYVYSASEKFAIFCKETGFATLVGARTGGDGIGIDPLVFMLPNSGICYRFSASLGLNSDGASNEEYGTGPDIPCNERDALPVCLKAVQEKRS